MVKSTSVNDVLPKQCCPLTEIKREWFRLREVRCLKNIFLEQIVICKAVMGMKITEILDGGILQPTLGDVTLLAATEDDAEQ